MSSIVERQPWTMPGWMEPFRAGFVGVRPQDVEDFYNDDSPAHINAARAIIGAQVKAQVGLLTSLWEAGLLAEPRQCLNRRRDDHTCQGFVTGQPSRAGTGTMIYRCQAGHDASEAHARKVRERYPDTDTPPGWFDPTAAGERWNDDY